MARQGEEDGIKAIVFEQMGGPEVLALRDVPKPDMRSGGVLIKTHAIRVSFADTRFRQGTYAVKPKLPDTPGLEAAGVIEAVGDGVTNLRLGTRVAAFTSKSYAEYALMRDGRLKLHVGKTFPLAQAAEAHRYLESRQSTGKLNLLP